MRPTCAGDKHVPDVSGAVQPPIEPQFVEWRPPTRGKQHERDGVGVLRDQGEIDSALDERGAERQRRTSADDEVRRVA
jgi:hypothetical protein